MDEMSEHGFSGKSDALKEFNLAKKNECFSNLVSKLKLPDEKLMKYTTTLEECSINYETCKNCKGLVHCSYKLCGYCYLPRVIDNRLEFDYQPCKYKSPRAVIGDLRHTGC